MHPSIQWGREALAARLTPKGIQLVLVEGDRSPERQAALYAQGRTTPGKRVTYARAYESAHNWGLAIDVRPEPDTPANWRTLRREAAAIGWGLIGEWDPGHLQHPEWPQYLALIRKHLQL